MSQHHRVIKSQQKLSSCDYGDLAVLLVSLILIVLVATGALK